MKKFFTMFILLITLFCTNVFAEEKEQNCNDNCISTYVLGVEYTYYFTHFNLGVSVGYDNSQGTFGEFGNNRKVSVSANVGFNTYLYPVFGSTDCSFMYDPRIKTIYCFSTKEVILQGNIIKFDFQLDHIQFGCECGCEYNPFGKTIGICYATNIGICF